VKTNIVNLGKGKEHEKTNHTLFCD